MAEKNRYQGVNAHLMSYLQNELTFKGFHNYFVVYLATHLNELLPENYHAATEDTLKILRTFVSRIPAPKTLYPDIAVREEAEQKVRFPAGIVAIPTLYVPLPKVEENKEPLSVAIYEENRAKPVTVIEMVSPGNKIGIKGRREYQEKRYLLTKAGVALIEIDLLHETPSVIDDLARYPDDFAATPYYIAVTDPAHSDKTAIYQFGINQPIPAINIPLLNDELLPCDFDKVYQESFTRGRFDNYVNYAEEPIKISTYDLRDQQKIREIMAKK